MPEITEERYNELLAKEKELDALHAGGVDNWEFYCEALADAGIGDDEDD